MTANAVWLGTQGVDVLVVNGTIGEAFSLSDRERAHAVEATAQGMSPDGVLVAGCSGDDVDTVVRRAHDAVSAVAQALLVAPPPRRLEPHECIEFFRAMDGEVRVPFIVYDNPASSLTVLDSDAIDRISRLGRFLALKEAHPDVVRFAEIVNQFGARFPVIAAAEDPLLFTLVAGASSCMTASAAFAPAVLRDLLEAVTRGDLETARTVYARIRAFRRLFIGRHHDGGPAYLPFTKAAVELCGGRAGPPRPPLEPISEVERSALTRVLAEEMRLTLSAE